MVIFFGYFIPNLQAPLNLKLQSTNQLLLHHMTVNCPINMPVSGCLTGRSTDAASPEMSKQR